jgi:hypothetical protein
MFAVQCTRKVLARFNRLPSADGKPASTRLGDWCATLIAIGDREVLLLVSMRSLLPVLIPALPTSALLDVFRDALAEVLARIGVPSASIEAELDEMKDARLTRTSNRQVLGSMTDFANLANAYPNARDLTEITLKLADAPCGPIAMRSPQDVAKRLLEAGE